MGKELTLIGTGHVFQIEKTIQDAIHALRPDVVFVELDRGRLQALLHRRQHGEAPPAKGAGWVQRRLMTFQQQVAGQYGAEVGGEMLAAVDAAQAIGARIALVDRPADVTLRRAMKQLTWREKLRGIKELLKGSVAGLRPGKRGDLEAELERYQKDPAAALAQLSNTFPTIHRVVIAERDALMATRIRRAMEQVERGVAVVGDGHVSGMQDLLADLEPTCYRLEAVRAGDLPKPTGDFTWTVNWPPQPS